MLKSIYYRPEALLVGTFVGLIATGSGLLALPVAQAGEPVGYLDALFTATSAVCVTGLITVDTPTAYSRFGHSVILILMQLGGLGIMTFGAIAAQLFRRRMSFTSQAAWQSTMFESQMRGDFRRMLRHILLMTVIFELFGMSLIWLGMQRGGAGAGDWFDAGFLSVSAFCNAGFSVYSDSVMGLTGSPLCMLTIMGLIILGGLGYPVLLECLRRGWRRVRGQPPEHVRWSLQTRLVLLVSASLLLFGFVALLLTGFGRPAESWPAYFLHAAFQSVTARTAGFHTVEVALLPVPAILLLVLLMFVGGSPGSCAGGIKTTTAVVWGSRIFARVRGQDAVVLAGRTIPHDVVRRAALVAALAVLWNGFGILLLAITEAGANPRFEHIIFEQVSAFATVGLSAGLTPDLSAAGKLWIIASMFAGRVGPLTVALAVLSQHRAPYTYPAERVMIG
jgi:trk system potassium uptake protein TrkH